MSENGILEAEQRVREMNRMTQQYSEQGNRYLQSMINAQNMRQTRFEPAVPYPQEKIGQGSFPQSRMAGSHREHYSQQNGFSNRQQNGNQNWQAGSPRGQYFSPNEQQNLSHSGQQGGNQNRQAGSPRGHYPQNNNCPPRGDPAGERRNMPQNNRNGNSRAGNLLPMPPEERSRNEIHNRQGNQNSPFGFPDLLADNEKLMILLLIYLLMKENADIKLILALGYLLM